MPPLVGEKVVIEGGNTTVKLPELVVEPLLVVTVMGPVAAPVGTATVMPVDVKAVTVAATVPLAAVNATAGVALEGTVKLLPVITTFCPMAPLAGLKPAMIGLVDMTNEVLVVKLPATLVMEIAPVVVPAATVAVSDVSETIWKAAGVPLKETDVVPSKPCPVMVTNVPAIPLVGEKPKMASVVRSWENSEVLPLASVAVAVKTVSEVAVAVRAKLTVPALLVVTGWRPR